MNHKTHNPDTTPCIGCPECDKAIKRPIKRGYGKGKSETVIPCKN